MTARPAVTETARDAYSTHRTATLARRSPRGMVDTKETVALRIN